MKVVELSIHKLKPYPNNPRHNAEAIEAVSKSLKQFGFRQPIVVDKDMVVVVGHTRLQAAKEIGLKVVPVHIAENMTPEQIQAYRLADNRLNSLSSWDSDKLFEELADLENAGFDMSGLGFSDEELGLEVEGMERKTKQDLRYLEDFEVMPKPKPKWILISAEEDECSTILSSINGLKLKTAKVEYSGEQSSHAKNKALP